ncbi:MAG: DUF6316 family protein [Gammaproteobacteria bacterium]|nr:DUF6316 family protein [Gammaproteobacteria bacterium]
MRNDSCPTTVSATTLRRWRRDSIRVREGEDGWYFSTREGRPMGPFDSREEAEQGLADFIEFIQLAPLETLVTLTDRLTPEDDHPDRED